MKLGGGPRRAQRPARHPCAAGQRRTSGGCGWASGIRANRRRPQQEVVDYVLKPPRSGGSRRDRRGDRCARSARGPTSRAGDMERAMLALHTRPRDARRRAQRDRNMSLKCGIVGLPNVGKSTLFNALTKAGIAAENYPFCTIEPNVGIVEVPDPRLAALAAIAKPREGASRRRSSSSTSPGLVAGASKGEGLGNQFLANIRETDAIAHVVRCFEDDNVVHVARQGRPDRPTSRRSTPSLRSPTSRRSTSRCRKVREARARRRRQGGAAHRRRARQGRAPC